MPTRRNHRANNFVIGGDFIGDGDDVGDGFAGQRVHTATGHIEDGMGNAVRVDFKGECFEFHFICLS